jgi:hypothetical protein
VTTPVAGVFIGCQNNGTYLLQVQNSSGTPLLQWVDDSSTGVTVQTLANLAAPPIFNGASGTRHVGLRDSNASGSAEFDIYFFGNGVDTCHISAERRQS